MKKQYLFVVVAILSLCFRSSYAQIVGTNVFLQGRYVEIGELGNGSFGATSSPAGYHAHPYCCSTTWSAGSALAEIYDYGHDGWSVGSPAFMGDYTYPGSPFEGWEIQIGSGRAQAYQYTGASYSTSGLTLTGSIAGYSNSGGIISSMWTGTAGGTLNMTQETRVDTLGSAVVVTTKMYNTTSSAISGIYYMRTCDPDNDESWAGGGFPTTNTITHQNEDATHRVLVSSQGALGAYTYMGLGTKDCRAKAFVYGSWGLSISVDLSTVWGGTYTDYATRYALGSSYYGDVGIGIVYNIGTIAANDSAVISYSYFWNGVNGIDSPGSLPDPQLVVNGTTIPNTALPPNAVVNDTFNACAAVGMTALPVGIRNGTTGDWTWSTWTWAPATGLSATTGTSLTIVTTALPPVITYTITGSDSATGMGSCNRRTMYLTVITCNNVLNNSPCYGDTLKLRRVGDSTGCTYFWYGPSGFTSTLQNPFKFPALYTDSGMYHVIRIRMGVRDTDSTRVLIRYKPDVTATSNAPLCAGMVDTLRLNVAPTIPGETFSWTGPGSWTSSLTNPTRTPFAAADSGLYTVYVTTGFGCKDTAVTRAGLVPQPPAPIITGPTPYCQFEPFVPFTVTLTTGGVAWWYPGSSGGVGTTVAPTVNTSIPGVTQVWASQKVGSCESPRSSYTVRVITRPAAPIVTGPMQYCQFIGPFVRDTVHTTGGGTPKWYTVATGGTGSPTQPTVDLSVSGPHNYWVSQTDSGCESPRTPVTITVHPKPNAPSVRRDKYCQFQWADQVFATTVPASSGDVLTWYIGSTTGTGTTLAPIPTTDSPGVQLFYVTATSAFGCVSNPSVDSVFIIPKPAPPHTRDTTYCQHFNAPSLKVNVDSAPGSHLRWYLSSSLLSGTPVPSTDIPTYPTGTTWFVSQVVAGCGSDSTPVNVKVIFLPDFTVDYRPWVCHHDSITLAYHGASLLNPVYNWTLPVGARFVDGSKKSDSMVTVAFDSAMQKAVIYLTASNNGGRCSTTDTISEKVIPLPNSHAFTKADVCLGDTVNLALADRSSGAQLFTWFVDGQPLGSSAALNLVSANSNSGGPFVISWIDSGHHVIQVKTQTVEGCKSKPTFDSIFVHAAPDATFKYFAREGHTLCIDDSIQFTANATAYNYSYTWAPEHGFENVNTPNTWGRVELSQSIITLTVTDPFGCSATTSVEIHPEACCTVNFPSAFTPNGDSKNDVFRPIFAGFHNFHVFRIVNRWGQTIFESTHNKMEWDGSYNGVPQDMGVYYYYLKYDCGGNTLETRGDVTLIR